MNQLPSIRRLIPRHCLAAAALLCMHPLVSAQETSASEATAVPVLYVYASASQESSVKERCWPVLVTQYEVLKREEQARPWLSRNIMSILGIVVGGAAGAIVLKQAASAEIVKRWLVPAFIGSGLAGYVVGPGGVAGAMAGGGVADRLRQLGKLGKHGRAKTIGGAMAGAMVGQMLWDIIFPPTEPTAPVMDADGDIELENFMRERTCAPAIQTARQESQQYRVGYRYNDTDYNVDLPYDPGDEVLVDSTGKAVGPGRMRQ